MRFWKAHSLTIILAVGVVLTMVWGTWGCYHTWAINQHTKHEAAPFWSQDFCAYLSVQAGPNYWAELIGLLTIVLLTKKFRERFSAEAPHDEDQ